MVFSVLRLICAGIKARMKLGTLQTNVHQNHGRVVHEARASATNGKTYELM